MMDLNKRIFEICLLSVVLGSQVRADQVGELVAHDRVAAMNMDSASARTCPVQAGAADQDANCPLRTRESSVSVGDTMRTDTGGRARVFLYNERFPTKRRQFEILNATTLRILENGVKISPLGKVRWVGEGVVELPRERSVRATNTEFIVSHTADGVTEVIALSEGVEVSDGEQGAREILHQGDRVVMEPGLRPRLLKRILRADLARETEPFLFIGGGRAESQTVRNTLLHGDKVPIPDRAPLQPPRWRDDDRLWPEQPVVFDLLVNF